MDKGTERLIALGLEVAVMYIMADVLGVKIPQSSIKVIDVDYHPVEAAPLQLSEGKHD